MPFTALAFLHLYGTVVGNGHCVALVRAAAGCPHTSLWLAGGPVRGAQLAEGTAIATFDGNGLYGNHTDGRSHACIFIEETDHGLRVADQWKLHKVSERVIRFKGGQGKPCDDGDAYRVIEV